MIFLIFLTLLPFSPLFFRGVDLWYGAGMYFQTGILLLLAWSFFEKQKEVRIKNLPLALLTLWLGINTLIFWYMGLKAGQHNFIVFGPFFNFICFLLFYKLSFNLTRKKIYKIIEYFSYSICVYLLWCVVQYFDFDPFFTVFAYADGLAIHRVVGFLGNETQNAVFLAMCLPVFYLRDNRFSYLCAALTWVILGILGSAIGLGTALVVTIFFSFFHRLSFIYYLFILIGIGIVLMVNDITTYLNPHGRFELWGKILPEIRFFGLGLGSFNHIAKRPDLIGWRHAHNEYLQILYTAGLFGLLTVIYCIYEYFRGMLKDRLSVTLASCFLGFCLVGCLYFPSHLWIMAGVACFSYSFQYVLKNEGVTNGTFYTSGD